MSEAIKTASPHEAAPDADLQIHATDILLHFIVTALAPMFLAASGDEISYARMAALETVNAYRARTHADLIAVAQVIAFGLAALGSLSLSMADNLSLSMTLRLRGNANACNRSAEQNRRALTQSRLDHPTPDRFEAADTPETPYTGDSRAQEEAMFASLAEAEKMLAKALSRQNTDQPTAPPAPAVAASVPRQHGQPARTPRSSDFVGEFTPSLFHQPRESRASSIRATALSSSASDLIGGARIPDVRTGPPASPWPLPAHAGTAP
jgi:hypothetical protein